MSTTQAPSTMLLLWIGGRNMKPRYQKPNPKPKTPVVDIYEPEPVEPTLDLASELAFEPPAVVEDIDEAFEDDLPELPDEDPEARHEIPKLKQEARKQVSLMLPRMYDKFANASAKDAAAIFDAVADRADFPRQNNKPQAGNINVLNLNPSDMLPLIEGLKKITEK